MDKHARKNRQARDKADRSAALQAPMGEHRYQELMSQLGQAFAAADPNANAAAQAEREAQQRLEREQEQRQWLERRTQAIAQIQDWIDHYKLSQEDLA